MDAVYFMKIMYTVTFHEKNVHVIIFHEKYGCCNISGWPSSNRFKIIRKMSVLRNCIHCSKFIHKERSDLLILRSASIKIKIIGCKLMSNTSIYKFHIHKLLLHHMDLHHLRPKLYTQNWPVL